MKNGTKLICFVPTTYAATIMLTHMIVISHIISGYILSCIIHHIYDIFCLDKTCMDKMNVIREEIIYNL